MTLDVDGILGPNGKIAQRLKHYEHRPQQLELARAVASALEDKQHLIAEAGTGVGKSFAYLVPAILHATADEGRLPTAEAGPEEDDDDEGQESRRVVISTHTISLQEQLIGKDLPLLNSVIPREFSSVLVKGRSNYVSIRRFQTALARATSLLDESEHQQLTQLQQWLKSTSDGSLSTIPFRPLGSLWDEVASDTSNCLGRNCKTYDECHYYRARRRIYGAQILVVNHALFFTDLALRTDLGFGVLPDYSAAILDECHTIESVASAHLGIKVTNGQVEYTLNKLYNPHTGKGLFVAMDMKNLQELVNRAHTALDQMMFDLDKVLLGEMTNRRIEDVQVVPNLLSEPLLEIAGKLNALADNARDASRRQDMMSASGRLESLAVDVQSWLRQDDSAAVYWLERSYSRRGHLRMEMHAAPIDLAPRMRESLFQQVPSVVLTSATVATGQQNSTSRRVSASRGRGAGQGGSGRQPGFEFFQSRVGAFGSRTAQLGSPFDFRRQAKLILVSDMPDPSGQRTDYERLLPKMIARYLTRTEGRAFVLFTSYGLLRSTAQKMHGWFAKNQMKLYSQGDGTAAGALLEQFKRQSRGALFGTDSFWQGVDVPGDSLSNVIITKLPFSVPDHPLLTARLDAIREAGGNPFMDYQVPEAIIKLRQGFGRLIRTAQDSGIVVLLDSRIESKFYGRSFLNALPETEVVRESVAAESSF